MKTIGTTTDDETVLSDEFEVIRRLPLVDRLLYWSRRFVGTPYLADPISETSPDSLRLDGFDCVTFAETVIAFSISVDSTQARDVLRELRYRNGIVSWEYRNHFMSIDWIWNNLLILRPVPAGSNRTMWLDRAAFFAKHDRTLPPELDRKVWMRLPFDTPDDFRKKRIADGAYLALFIGREDWLIVEHVGLFFPLAGQNLLFHASRNSGNVVAVEMMGYFEDVQKFQGVSLFEIKEHDK